MNDTSFYYDEEMYYICIKCCNTSFNIEQEMGDCCYDDDNLHLIPISCYYSTKKIQIWYKRMKLYKLYWKYIEYIEKQRMHPNHNYLKNLVNSFD